MSCNRYIPHAFVLPEDEADSDIANGFLLSAPNSELQILPYRNGWKTVVKYFCEKLTKPMFNYTHMHVILFVDFDGEKNRREDIMKEIPINLHPRVFVLGALSEPEDLKADLGSFEQIGDKLAQDCRNDTMITWQHELLKHNIAELDRMLPIIKTILFPGQ